MYAFVWSQLIAYLVVVCPGSTSFRLVLLSAILPAVLRNPFLSCLGILWQSYSLAPAWFDPGHEFLWGTTPLLRLPCEQNFWFLCNSSEPILFLSFLSSTRLGEWAIFLRGFVEERCHRWDELWGPLAFSLLIGGVVDTDIKKLYRNLGFLHVLVVSGSQFSLLSRWIENILRKPIAMAYASTMINWRVFRELKYLVDFLLQAFLAVYLLASGGTAPCQRAFLVHSSQIASRWYFQPLKEFSGGKIFLWQMLLFPQSWFSLSNALSWGAVYCLESFRKDKSLGDQLKTSTAIQCLNLALFNRISIAALCLDFFIAPLWDVMLFAALSAIFIEQLEWGEYLSVGLNLLHDCLGWIESWQNAVFGSSSLSLRNSFLSLGRIAALLLCILISRSYFKNSKAEVAS